MVMIRERFIYDSVTDTQTTQTITINELWYHGDEIARLPVGSDVKIDDVVKISTDHGFRVTKITDNSHMRRLPHIKIEGESIHSGTN